MFHKTNQNTDLKSETERLWPPAPPKSGAGGSNERSAPLTQSSHSRQYQSPLGNNSKEDSKSHRLRNSNFNSLSQQRSHRTIAATTTPTTATTTNQEEMDSSNNHNSNLNQRNGQNLHRSTTNPHLNQIPSYQHPNFPSTSTPAPPATSSSSSKSAFSKEFSVHPSSRQQLQQYKHQFKPRSSSVTTITNLSNLRELYNKSSAHNSNQQQQQQQQETRQHQHDFGSDEVMTAMVGGNKEGLSEDNSNGFKDVELETLGSLERDLPVELSFLIRQQAYCMARMNYLDRQIRELKDSRQNVANTSSHSTPINQIQQATRTALLYPNTTATTITTTNLHAGKNGNFIPSDDSGGEYSRATISDDDELSSLLDQIAKSVKPERNMSQINVNNGGISNIGNSQAIRSNYGVISNQPQQYAILNPNQLHHHHQAAVPVFFMGPSIAMAHPSSINSSVLPGVHFQSEPQRYNQYYDDLYAQNTNTSVSAMHGRHDGTRNRQFDSSIAAIEQLVSQKERRQIKSQLKSADNWLKMRSSGLCNLNDNFSSNINNIGTDVAGSIGERNHHQQQITSSSATIATDNNVIEEMRRSR